MTRMRTLALALLFTMLAVVPAAAQTLPACAASSTPSLERYDQLTPGARFRVTLHYDEAAHAWLPSPAIAMPLHHASLLDTGDFALPPPSARTITLEVTAIERVLDRYEEREHTWFFRYRVRVESACE